jgi:hypothetical protein
MPIKIDNFSVTSVIQSFGGVARLSAKLERSGHPISPGGIEKWRERNNIPGRVLVKLAQIAEDEGWQLQLTDFLTAAPTPGGKDDEHHRT